MTHHTGAVPDTLEPAGQWIKSAACIGFADLMFPDNCEAGIETAKRICAPCTVKTECVLDALRTDDNQFGIRGGLKPGERRALARRMTGHAGRQPVEEPAPEPEPRPVRTFASLWQERAQPVNGGHMAWTGGVPVFFQGRTYTPRQIAFRLDRGHPPVGIVRRTCPVDGCVLPAHLMDQQERNARRAERAGASA